MEIYTHRKQNGVCVMCGVNKPDLGNVYCNTCLNVKRIKDRKNKEYLKKIGFCTRCGKYPAEDGKHICTDCRMYLNEKARRFRERNKDAIAIQKREYSKKVRSEWIASGRCSNCGREKPDDGYKICYQCRMHKRIINRKSHKKKSPQPYIDYSEWASYGICSKCGRNPVMEGKKVCTTCYGKLYLTITKAQKTADRTYFRQLNNGLKSIKKAEVS